MFGFFSAIAWARETSRSATATTSTPGSLSRWSRYVPEMTPVPTPPRMDAGPRLTRRGREVVALVARGLSNREIADQLVLSERTVEAHVTHVLSKLGVRSRAQAAVWTVEHNPLSD